MASPFEVELDPFQVPALRSAGETQMWYACYTRARHEKQVARWLEGRGFTPFLPMIPRKRQWRDRVTSVAWPLFPNYVFARFHLEDLHRVLSTPGVGSVVKTNGVPVPVREAEIDNVRRFVERCARFGGPEPEPVPYPREGDHVRVVSGPLRGVEGIVVEIRGRKRVVVGLKAIGQGLLVHVDVGSVRKPSPAHSRSHRR